MTKQGKIREGMAKKLYCLGHPEITNKEKCWRQKSEEGKKHWREEADEIFSYLHSQGIKLPDGSNLIAEKVKLPQVVGGEANDEPQRKCCVCGITSSDVDEVPTYRMGIDTTDYFCKDVDACLDRKEEKDKLYKQFPVKKKYRTVNPTSEPYKPTSVEGER